MCLFSQQESRPGNEGGLSSEVREQGQTWEYLRGLVGSQGGTRHRNPSVRGEESAAGDGVGGVCDILGLKVQAPLGF